MDTRNNQREKLGRFCQRYVLYPFFDQISRHSSEIRFVYQLLMSHGVVNANRASCNFSFAASFTNGHQFPSRKSINVIRLLSRETLIKCTRALLLNASGLERNNGTIIVKKCINSKQILKPERERDRKRERGGGGSSLGDCFAFKCKMDSFRFHRRATTLSGFGKER